MTSTLKSNVFLVMPIVLMAFVVFCSSDMQGQRETRASMQCGNNDTNDGGSEAYVDDKRSYCPCTGVVLDAETRKPIAGAQVKANASYTGGIGIELVDTNEYEFTQTDKDGKYHIPKISGGGLFMENSMLSLVIYKAGYIAYNSLYAFKGAIPKSRFTITNNTVLLEKWDDKRFTIRDRVEHARMIGCESPGAGVGGDKKKAEQFNEFCREAREEMIFLCMSSSLERDRCVKIVDRNLGLLRKGE